VSEPSTARDAVRDRVGFRLERMDAVRITIDMPSEAPSRMRIGVFALPLNTIVVHTNMEYVCVRELL
jgi:hypothetical protein